MSRKTLEKLLSRAVRLAEKQLANIAKVFKTAQAVDFNFPEEPRVLTKYLVLVYS